MELLIKTTDGILFTALVNGISTTIAVRVNGFEIIRYSIVKSHIALYTVRTVVINEIFFFKTCSGKRSEVGNVNHGFIPIQIQTIKVLASCLIVWILWI